ncbi:hypothetical protein [Sorangium sp. So ce1389]|uniref:hypothetical protein n=1 Tax=Sorangium sp. So ce1389 TaxID=3133336 RepID=UPI003F61118E
MSSIISTVWGPLPPTPVVAEVVAVVVEVVVVVVGSVVPVVVVVVGLPVPDVVLAEPPPAPPLPSPPSSPHATNAATARPQRAKLNPRRKILFFMGSYLRIYLRLIRSHLTPDIM